MDRKIIGIGIGAVLVIGLVAIMGSVFAQNTRSEASAGFNDADNDGLCDNAGSGNCQYRNQASGGFVDADGDGNCDNAANCPMQNANGGCCGTGGCQRLKEGFKGGCHRASAE
ncbi:MAG: hypothetical protein V1859_01125 [archaeon]